MVTLRGPPLDPSKHIILIILGALWVYGALGDILSSIMSNSHFRKRPGARDMMICFAIFKPLRALPSYIPFVLALLAAGALGNMLTSIVSNSHFGKRLVTRDTTILGSQVGPHNMHW